MPPCPALRLGRQLRNISAVGSTKSVMITVKLNKENATGQLVSPSQQDRREMYHVGNSTFACV